MISCFTNFRIRLSNSVSNRVNEGVVIMMLSKLETKGNERPVE